MGKLSQEQRDIFADAYRFYESHFDMPDNVASWTKCAKDACEISAKHGNSQLAIKLLEACYWAIDEETILAREAIANANGCRQADLC